MGESQRTVGRWGVLFHKEFRMKAPRTPLTSTFTFPELTLLTALGTCYFPEDAPLALCPGAG